MSLQIISHHQKRQVFFNLSIQRVPLNRPPLDPLMQLEASIRVVEQRGHLLFRGLLPWWCFFGPQGAWMCFLDVFFLGGGAKNEDGCCLFFFQRMGIFFGEQ